MKLNIVSIQQVHINIMLVETLIRHVQVCLLFSHTVSRYKKVNVAISKSDLRY